MQEDVDAVVVYDGWLKRKSRGGEQKGGGECDLFNKSFQILHSLISLNQSVLSRLQLGPYLQIFMALCYYNRDYLHIHM